MADAQSNRAVGHTHTPPRDAMLSLGNPATDPTRQIAMRHEQGRLAVRAFESSHTYVMGPRSGYWINPVTGAD